MPDRTSSQAEAAYRRAASAYQQGSYEEAHRSAREALGFDPDHRAAISLLRRLGVQDSGPQVVSTDPTVLIGRTTDPAPRPPTDPTMIVPRVQRRPAPQARQTPPTPPPRKAGYRASEPTVIVSPSVGGAERGTRDGSGAGLSLWQRLRGGGSRPSSPGGGPRSIWTPGAQGILMVAGAIALAGFGVWAAFQGFRWLSPVGEELIVEVGEGGQIEGPDIRCGAGSQRCSTIVPTGQRVELTVKAASGFEFTGFTGDCEASGGSLLMDASKKCGARFERIGGQVSAATYTLSIDKPTGGTIVAAGITCGALGSDCSEEVPAGESVELRFQAEDNYRFDSFYKECGEGEFVMNSARTCGAVFIPAPGGVNRIPVSPPDMPERAPRRSGPDTSAPSRPKPSTTVPVQPETGTQPPAPPVGASTSTPAPTVTPANPVQEQPLAPQKPPEAPQTQEDHAKGQIKARVEEYCELRGTLDAKRVAALFHANDERQFRVTFKEYKSLACTVAGQPEYLAFDAGPAGVAKIKFEIKETIKLSSGGAPKVSEVVVTMVLSRKSQRSDWLIDRVEHAAKPK